MNLTVAETNRYQLYVSDAPGEAAAVRVHDSVLNRILLAWRGAVARRLIDSQLLRFCARSASCHGCDKKLIRELAMTAASIAMSLEHRADVDLLSRRLRELDLRLPALHAHIANLLFAHPERHFAHEEIVCLLSLTRPSLCRRQVDECLDELVRMRVVQRVDVDGAGVFYDIDTRPHLHVYCERTRELFDAPGAGVLTMPRPSSRHASCSSPRP